MKLLMPVLGQLKLHGWASKTFLQSFLRDHQHKQSSKLFPKAMGTLKNSQVIDGVLCWFKAIKYLF